jgi:hypothetical protein
MIFFVSQALMNVVSYALAAKMTPNMESLVGFEHCKQIAGKSLAKLAIAGLLPGEQMNTSYMKNHLTICSIRSITSMAGNDILNSDSFILPKYHSNTIHLDHDSIMLLHSNIRIVVCKCKHPKLYSSRDLYYHQREETS